MVIILPVLVDYSCTKVDTFTGLQLDLLGRTRRMIGVVGGFLCCVDLAYQRRGTVAMQMTVRAGHRDQGMV